MKNLKHPVCLLLISALLLGVLPLGVHADTAITEVNITGFRTPYVGQTAGANLASVDVPEGAHYEITSLDWQKAANGNFLEGSDDFAAGNEYYLCFVLSPAEGYAFSENCAVLINGAADQVDGDYTRWNADGTLTFYSVNIEPTVPQVVARIDLTGFVMPQVGQTAGGNLASLSVPAGAGYTVTEAFWRSGGEEMAASDCFTANTTCYICFTVALAEGYVFDFDEGAVVYINGDTSLVDSGYTQILTNNSLQCYTVDLTPDAAAGDVPIEEVRVNGFTLPQPGDTAANNLANLSVPAGAHYTIYSAAWWHYQPDAGNPAKMNDGDVFTAGERAYLYITFAPADGYRFDRDALPTATGFDPQYVNDSYLSNDGRLCAYVSSLTVGGTAALTPIETVFVNGFTLPQPGDTPAQNLAGLSVPAGAHYSIDDAYWLHSGTGGSGSSAMNDDDVFTDSDWAYLAIVFSPANGYRFDEDALPTVNGLAPLALNYSYVSYDGTLHAVSTGFTVGSEPGVDTAIETVAVNGFTVPQPGDTASENIALLSIPDGALYDVIQWDWFDKETGSRMKASDVFDANKRYYLFVRLEAYTGFSLSNATVPYVNGGTELIDGASYDDEYGTFDFSTVVVQPGVGPVEDVLIEEININGFTVPQPGETVSANLALLSLPEGANYYIYWRGWYDEDAEKTMSESDVFNADHTYSFGVRLKANAGYAFSAETDPFVNGGTDFVDYNYCCYYNSSGYYQIWTVAVQPGAGPVEDVLIEEVNVSGFTVPQPGDTVSENLALLSIPTGVNYFVGAWRWYDEEAGALMSDSDVFDANKTYSLWVRIYAYVGYAVSNATEPHVNSGTALVDSRYNYYRSDIKAFEFYSVVVQPGVGPVTVEVIPIEEVNVSGFTVPQPGDTASENLALLSLPSGAHYYVGASGWYDEAAYKTMSDSDVFDADKTYSLWVRLYANSGYTLSNETVAHVNGGTVLADGGYSHYNSDNDSFVIWSVVVQPGVRKKITSVDITELKVPREGQTAGGYIASIPLPEDAEYFVASASWYLKPEGGEEFAEMADTDVFTAGGTAYLRLTLAPCAGYCFDADNLPGVWCHQRMRIRSKEVDSDGNLVLYIRDVTVKPIPTGTKIEEVRINGFTAPTAGHTAGENFASLTLPDGAPYEIENAEWGTSGWVYTMDASEKFEPHQTYYLRLELQPKEGYYFDEDGTPPTVQFDGSDSYVETDSTYVTDSGSCICFSIDFELDPAPGTLPVVEIAINGFVSPRVGQTAGDNLASVTVPDGAPYTVSDMYWKNYGVGTMAASDVFEAGKTYYLVAAFFHADGYYFDPDTPPAFLVNGSDEYSDGCNLRNSVLSCYTVDYEMPAALRGDINADGSVDITDVTALLNILADSGASDLAICDLDGSGSVSITDVTALLNILAGN